MSEITQILKAIDQRQPEVAEQLLPLVYDELRRLAAQKLAAEQPGLTLQATALVHEAYVRLVAGEDDLHWNGRGHFFAAAAEAMRRILIENARRKQSLKGGGGRRRLPLDGQEPAIVESNEDLLALDEALDRLAVKDPAAARLVQLRYFAGLTLPDAAEALAIAPRTAGRLWAFARAWLRREIEGDDRPEEKT